MPILEFDPAPSFTFKRNVGKTFTSTAFDFLMGRLQNPAACKAAQFTCTDQVVAAQVRQLTADVRAKFGLLRAPVLLEIARTNLVPNGLRETGLVSREWLNFIIGNSTVYLDTNGGATVLDELLELFKRAQEPRTMELVIKALKFGVNAGSPKGMQRAACNTLAEIATLLDTKAVGQNREILVGVLKDALGIAGSWPATQEAPVCPPWKQPATAGMKPLPKDAFDLSLMTPPGDPNDPPPKKDKFKMPAWGWALVGVGGAGLLWKLLDVFGGRQRARLRD